MKLLRHYITGIDLQYQFNLKYKIVRIEVLFNTINNIYKHFFKYKKKR